MAQGTEPENQVHPQFQRGVDARQIDRGDSVWGKSQVADHRTRHDVERSCAFLPARIRSGRLPSFSNEDTVLIDEDSAPASQARPRVPAGGSLLLPERN